MADVRVGSGAAGPPALLTATAVTRRYGSLTAVDAVDLRVVEGERHALIGPNGAGKTTLLDLVGGATRVDDGRIDFAGRDVTRLGPARRARLGIGRIHQRPAVWSSLTVRENVEVAAWRRVGGLRRVATPGRFRRRLREPALALLDRVGLADLATSTAAHLSHGQRRLLEIAMALANQPRLLLLDEPAAGLSGVEVQRLAALLAGLPREVSVLLVEHRLDLVYALADTVTVLYDGRRVASGGPAEIRDSPEVRRAYAEAVR
ncbi:ABC transporter ATP-binding protein [Micromonospora sp. HM5-17]|jgi:branched-chain amino acid transport system ATP-binding protein|uniref:ABC transporter ATP-binding protein n=1 Tax=Micromonospora sp. HM5-17 TaxID=2487710 RepID=UPI000F481C33|nr:ABC transporter ATP-binding protein [Micromonospora sp. HM5-17]ROT28310.1 ABC transporter ATP-binding protein [Micromonospora sp. HM5-17]